MAKSKRIIIKLISSKSSYFYTTTKNKINTVKKINIKKYDPLIKKHIIFNEKKI